MKKSVFLLFSLLAFSCSRTSSVEEETARLLQLHEQQRQAHFGKDAKAMLAHSSPDMISVNAGKIHVGSGDQDAAAFQSYFNSVEFRKWDDVKPPVIRFSEDRTLAYTVVDKLVVLTTKDSLGRNIEETTHYAWVSIYRKQQDGNWKLECIASTNEPEKVVPL
ncbi:YybH family protein [Sabulibacter ruber]|uniref:YybH family protein n=1 Tax=Sabulibacter ruber TaxID=2811901 RepID=UPI001A960070|nr:nuclear transport factor 2 family protein [Sabulibacter ruber]